MKHWDAKTSKSVDRPDIDAFIEDVISVCKKHGFSISHEDGHGAFEIEQYTDGFSNWLKNAHVGSSISQPEG